MEDASGPVRMRRLLEICRRLRPDLPAKISALARDLGVTERTIRRDLHDIRAVFGKAIEQDDYGGWVVRTPIITAEFLADYVRTTLTGGANHSPQTITLRIFRTAQEEWKQHEWAPGQRIIRDPRGCCVVEFEGRADHVLLQEILKRAPWVEVLAPAELRLQVARMAGATAQLHRKRGT